MKNSFIIVILILSVFNTKAQSTLDINVKDCRMKHRDVYITEFRFYKEDNIYGQ